MDYRVEHFEACGFLKDFLLLLEIEKNARNNTNTKNHNWFPIDGWHASGTFFNDPKASRKKRKVTAAQWQGCIRHKVAKTNVVFLSHSSSISDRGISLGEDWQFLFFEFGYSSFLGGGPLFIGKSRLHMVEYIMQRIWL